MNRPQATRPTDPETLKACCAAAYEQDLVALLLGESYHPGGLDLTRHLARTLDLRPGQRVLDVAAGRGATACLLAAEFGVDVDGIDLGPTSVERARLGASERGLDRRVRFHQGDAERLPFNDGTFDAVICECAWCTFPDKATAATEFARVLRPGGQVGITDVTLDRARIDPELAALAGYLACIADARPAAEYAALLEGAGLRVVASEPHDDALTRMIDPASLAVLGGGAIGCELAQAFRRLGADVTVIEALDRLLPREEPEASAAVAEAFTAEGIELRTGQRLQRVEPLDVQGAVRLHLNSGDIVIADRVLVAIGRRGATAELGLESAGVATDGGFVRVDDRLATTTPGIWAAGDVTGLLQFTHAADEMGRVAAANALSRHGRRRFDTSAIPWVTFTSPEVARVGMSEAETAARGGRILGATIVAERGGELVHEAALAMRTHMFTGRLAQAVHASPTWSMAIRQAAAQFFMEVNGRRARPAQFAQRHQGPVTPERR